MLEVEIVRIDMSKKNSQIVKDFVAEEKPLYIFLNRTHLATILCTPESLKELAIGHLISEGILKSIEEIEEISLEEAVCRIKLTKDVDLDKRLRLLKTYSRIITSVCGSRMPYKPLYKIHKIRSSLRIRAETVHDTVNQLNFIAGIFRKTGGVHAAAIAKKDGSIIASAEDVGRHNAVDKVIGMSLMTGINLRECFLVLSGRLSGDVVTKAARVGMPLIASLAAAIDTGIITARDVRLTLVGFARGKRLNVYSCPERIIVQ